MAFRAMTQEERAVIAAADKAGVIRAMSGPERSRFINDLWRDVNAARARVVAVSTSIAAASVKSTDKPRTPAVWSWERAKPSSGVTPKVHTHIRAPRRAYLARTY